MCKLTSYRVWRVTEQCGQPTTSPLWTFLTWRVRLDLSKKVISQPSNVQGRFKDCKSPFFAFFILLPPSFPFFILLPDFFLVTSLTPRKRRFCSVSSTPTIFRFPRMLVDVAVGAEQKKLFKISHLYPQLNKNQSAANTKKHPIWKSLSETTTFSHSKLKNKTQKCSIHASLSFLRFPFILLVQVDT